MSMRKLAVLFAVLAAAVVLAGGSLAAYAQSAGGAGSREPIPTFSTENIGRQGHFYVGGKYERHNFGFAGEPGKLMMRGAMYVETWVPKTVRHPYPIVFITGSVGQATYPLLQTPDGRPGWAYDFVNQGYTIYFMDYPARGRSPYLPGVDGIPMPPRSPELMAEVWTNGIEPATPESDWPQRKKLTQFPGTGKIGDPIFDYYAKTSLHGVSGGPELERMTVDAIVELLDRINQPVILILHSGVSATGWVVADRRSNMIKAIVAAEPVAPPIENAERGATGPGRLWGLSNLPITYDPPARTSSELQVVKQTKADEPDLIPCWTQREPARKLINLQKIPVLNVVGEASYHRPYAHCVAKWLNQAGVKTTFVKLEEVGLPGNGHQFYSEKNSAEIAKYFMSWLDKTAR